MPYRTVADIGGLLSKSPVDAGAFGELGDVILNRQHNASWILWRELDGGGLELTDSVERLSLRAEISRNIERTFGTW